MTEHEIEQKVKKAFTSNVPDVLDQVLSECAKQEGRVIMMTEIKSRKRMIRWAASAAAMFVLLFAGLFGTHVYQTNSRVDSVVSLDVNPSIEIEINQKEKVLAVNPLNEDGKTVIGNMDFKGSDMETTVNALLGSMLRNGYLNDASNSILVSVYGNDSKKAGALQEKLSEEVSAMLQNETFSGAVLSQVVLPDSKLQELADKYGISLGKACLIQQYISQDPQYSFEDLVDLTINELNLMSRTNGITLEDIQLVGNVSDKAYIGIDKAKELALSEAGAASEDDVTKLEMEMDYEHGVMIYEVSFIYENNKYNYDINANTGEIMEAKINPVEDKKTAEKDQQESSSDDSSVNDAEGTKNENSDKTKETEETKDGSSENKGTAETDKNKSSSNNSSTNNAGSTKKEDTNSNTVTDTDSNAENNTNSNINNNANSSTNSNTNNNTKDTKEDKANPTDNKENTETDNNKTSSDKNSTKGTDNTKKEEKSASTVSGYIGEERAKEAALLRAQLNAGEITDYKCETYLQKDTPVYKIKFVSDRYQYSCDVNALTGEIVKYEKKAM